MGNPMKNARRPVALAALLVIVVFVAILVLRPTQPEDTCRDWLHNADGLNAIAINCAGEKQP
jgi:hypothetical protein